MLSLLDAHIQDAEFRRRLGNSFGYISVGCWILVYSPQIYTQFRLKSTKGLSLAFLLIWLAADLANLVGAKWQSLLTTMIYLPIWYTFCDFVLLGQIIYYSTMRKKYPNYYNQYDKSFDDDDYTSNAASSGLPSPVTESSNLLNNSSRSSSSGQKHHSRRIRKLWSIMIHYGEITAAVLSFVFVVGLGIGAWIDTGRNGTPGPSNEQWDTKAQIIGWISAFLYLSSRVPQISKNTETKCQGFNILLSTYALFGNITYILSILLPSVEAEHVWLNFAWLVGSAGTVFMDFVVLSQFFYYRKERKLRESLAAVTN